MDLSIITNATKNLGRTIDRNSPTILTALSVVGLLNTVVLSVRATTKANKVLTEEANFRADEWSEQTGESESAYPDDFFTPKEIVEICWPIYVPTIISGVVTIACMIGSNHISLRRNAALASLFSLTETTLREYQEKVKEQIGEKKAEKIESDIAQDRINAKPPEEKTIIITGHGDYLCFDSFSSRYFRSNIDALKKIENTFNQRLLREDWLSINELYYELGLENIELGDEMGWIAERSLLEFKFWSKMYKDEPCCVVDYIVKPHHI